MNYPENISNSGQVTTPAAGTFYTDIIKKSPVFNLTNRITDMNLLFPPFMQKINLILQEAKVSNRPLMVFETYRSQARQQMLFTEKATKLETVGVHHYGLACDLVKDIAGEPSWKGDFTFFEGLCKTHGLVWGGDWGQPNKLHSFIDEDHIQMINVCDQAKLFAGGWYPDQDYKAVLG